AAPAEPPRSCRPSSPCTTSKRTATQDEKGSLNTDDLTTLGLLLERYRWRGEKPFVVTHTPPDTALTDLLHRHQVALIYRGPPPTTAPPTLRLGANVRIVHRPDATTRTHTETLSPDVFHTAATSMPPPTGETPSTILADWLTTTDRVQAR
ncbi:hypothetical protein ACIBEF_32405, partial [Micromonospora sp. NPDC050795]|uniref:hypothetical protein n=1 Tax=Micromonospora sp. NPDC050795 TaxID=3364282 RepID=UPI00379E367E